MLPILAQIKFEPTISFGNVIWSLSCLVLAVAAWRDMNWRMKNMEKWQAITDEENKKRDAIITRLDKVLYHLSGGTEARGFYIRRDESRTDYEGPERRKKP